MRAIVVCHDTYVRRRLEASLEGLHFPFHVHEPVALHSQCNPRDAIYCIDSQSAATLPRLPGPTLIILSGAHIPDEAFATICAQRWGVLRLAELCPHRLLNGLISTFVQTDVDEFVPKLRELQRFEQVPAEVITTFIRNAADMTRLQDLRRHLAPLSRCAAQDLIRSSGFDRAEHLFTALRCALWILLCECGVHRKLTEEYLGIIDLGGFRRACRRADVPALHRGLNLEAFQAASTFARRRPRRADADSASARRRSHSVDVPAELAELPAGG